MIVRIRMFIFVSGMMIVGKLSDQRVEFIQIAINVVIHQKMLMRRGREKFIIVWERISVTFVDVG